MKTATHTDIEQLEAALKLMEEYRVISVELPSGLKIEKPILPPKAVKEEEISKNPFPELESKSMEDQLAQFEKDYLNGN
jgi:hypothetical protein